MAITLETRTETTQQRCLTVPRRDLLDLLLAAGKLPASAAASAPGMPVVDVSYDEGDQELLVVWTERAASSTKEEP